jgi:Skp family chaperone for outer membrane proteins
VRKLLFVPCVLAVLAGCGPSSPVGTVDVTRITTNWDKYQGYQNQLLADEQAIATSKASSGEKARQAGALRQKYAKITLDLTDEIRTAASKVAQQKQLKLVVTKEGVGYGGTDITPDVEKELNVTEKPTPTP